MLLEIFTKFNRPKTYLLLVNILLVFFLIILSNLQILPIKKISDFIFFAVLYLAFALYRPGWSFLFFIGVIALENINLAPPEIGIMVRPYQFVGSLTIVAVLIKTAVNRLGFALPKWNWYDFLFIIFAIAGFLSAFGSLDKVISLKHSVIIGSFVALYFLVRIFIQSFDDLKRVAPFFFSSSCVIILYGIWQNINFALGTKSFAVMPGRPNSTFTEPDWLGIFLVFLLATIYATIYHRYAERTRQSVKKSDNQIIISTWSIDRLKMAFLYLALTLNFILLILTVSRSAWLGAFAVTFAFLFLILTDLKWNPKNWQWKTAFRMKILVIVSALLGVAIVHFLNLTSFQLFNRVYSTGSGLQKITIACDLKAQSLDIQKLNSQPIDHSSDLAKYGCRHINLADIESEKNAGNFVTEVFRIDPNVNIRKIIYQKSWDKIRHHPILGVGWGNIGSVLGIDERGTGLNSSNIFLEVWLGAGLLGISVFILILLYNLIFGIHRFIAQGNQKILGLLVLLGLCAFIVPNLFNAGIMLGYLWIFFSLIIIKDENRH